MLKRQKSTVQYIGTINLIQFITTYLVLPIHKSQDIILL